MCLSPSAIQKAKDIASKVAVRFVQGDVLDPPRLGPPFPFFFDRGCYHVVRRINVDDYLKTLNEITSPDAIGLVLAGNAKEPKVEDGPPVVSEEEIRSELSRFFEIQWLREFRFDPPPKTNENFLAWSCFLKKKPQ